MALPMGLGDRFAPYHDSNKKWTAYQNKTGLCPVMAERLLKGSHGDGPTTRSNGTKGEFLHPVGNQGSDVDAKGSNLSFQVKLEKDEINSQCENPMSKVKEITRDNATPFLSQYDTILLDCDGVTWKPDHHTHIPGVEKAIKRLQDMGKQLLFVSNNSMYSRKAYALKFKQHGFSSDPENIFCVSHAAAVYLKDVMKVKSKIYVLGTKMMESELNSASLENFGAGADPDPPFMTIEELRDLEYKDDVGVVLVGFDLHFNMNKLCKASTYLVNPECVFLATDDLEKSVITPPNIRIPIAGTVVEALKSSAKRDPVVLGKPNTLLFTCIMAAHPTIVPSRTIMIGDSLATDIAFANNVGIDSALVLSGTTSYDGMMNAKEPTPKYFMESLAVLADD